MGAHYGVRWMGRNYNQENWDLADGINRAISAANAAFYGLCTAVITSMGFIPSLGFIHSAGPLAFVYDIADVYKPSTTLEAAFHAISINNQATEQDVISLMKQKIEQQKLMKVIPKQLEEIFK
jgi:CRISPR-associated protein Cas1